MCISFLRLVDFSAEKEICVKVIFDVSERKSSSCLLFGLLKHYRVTLLNSSSIVRISSIESREKEDILNSSTFQ